MKKFASTATSAAALVIMTGTVIVTERVAYAQISESKTTAAPSTSEAPLSPDVSAASETNTAKSEVVSGQGAGEKKAVSDDNAPPSDEGAAAGASVAGAPVASGAAADGSTQSSSPEVEAQSDAERQHESTLLRADSKDLEQKSAEKADPEPEVSPNDLPFTYHQKHIDVAAGVALIGANSSGLDPYVENPLLAEGFVRVGATVMTSGPWAVSLFGGLGGGSYSSYARDQESRLRVFQLNVSAEARYHFHHRFYGYGRLALGPELASTRIGSDDENLRLSSSNWAFRGEATAGIAMRVVGSSDGRERSPRVWLFLEGGYRLSSSHAQNLSTDEEDGPARPVELELASLSTSGGLGNAGLMLTF